MSRAGWLSGRRTNRRLSGRGWFTGLGREGLACVLALVTVVSGPRERAIVAYVDCARPAGRLGVRLGAEPGWSGSGGLLSSGCPGTLMPLMKALKWRWATEARSSLRVARALRKWGGRPETWFRCLSRKAAIGLNTVCPSEALVVAATVESRRAD
jgi:hypothetical protein